MVARPLAYDGTNTLQDMTDANLERLIYVLQESYANQLINNGNGHLNVGGSGTTIGTAVDTSATQQIDGNLRILNDGIVQTYPAYPGIGTETDATYTYKQLRTVPSAVSSADFNVNGMIFYDSAADEFVPFSTEAQLATVIVDQAITNMRTGDEVGSYRVSTTTPTNGGAGTWFNAGLWYQDTTYSAGSTNYNLWIKTGLTTPPGSADDTPLGLDSDGGGTAVGNFRTRSASSNGRLVNNVLLPALTRKMSSGLYYSVATSISGINRGAFTNTKQTGTTNTRDIAADNIDGVYGTFYRSISTPSGAASTVTTYSLNMLA
jgi:hypothetical protein